MDQNLRNENPRQLQAIVQLDNYHLKTLKEWNNIIKFNFIDVYPPAVLAEKIRVVNMNWEEAEAIQMREDESGQQH